MKKIFPLLYNSLRRVFLVIKAKLKYADFPSDIFKLWAENFGIALDISCLQRLENICQKLKPYLIFEFGSGVSIALLTKYASTNPCKITVFEDNHFYLEKVKQNIYQKKVADKFTLISDLSGSFSPAKMDLVIIDGPTDYHRLANKSLYRKIISPNTICLIDDTDRAFLNALALRIAKVNSLEKVDFRDAFYSKKHQYSFLVPSKLKVEEVL